MTTVGGASHSIYKHALMSILVALFQRKLNLESEGADHSESDSNADQISQAVGNTQASNSEAQVCIIYKDLYVNNGQYVYSIES